MEERGRATGAARARFWCPASQRERRRSTLEAVIVSARSKAWKRQRRKQSAQACLGCEVCRLCVSREKRRCEWLYFTADAGQQAPGPGWQKGRRSSEALDVRSRLGSRVRRAGEEERVEMPDLETRFVMSV